MNLTTRRQFLTNVSVLVAAAGLPHNTMARSSHKARIVVVGGGFGGATCAKYLKELNPSLHVTLIERDTEFRTCPFSNLYLGGQKQIDDITHGYDALQTKYDINVLHNEVNEIDPSNHRLSTKLKLLLLQQ